jgi:hypothetical protein
LSAPVEAPPVERKPTAGKRVPRLRTEAVPSLPVVDVVLHYRNPRKIARLAERSKGRLRVVDAKTAYFRLNASERGAPALYATLKDLLRLAERSV